MALHSRTNDRIIIFLVICPVCNKTKKHFFFFCLVNCDQTFWIMWSSIEQKWYCRDLTYFCLVCGKGVLITVTRTRHKRRPCDFHFMIAMQNSLLTAAATSTTTEKMKRVSSQVCPESHLSYALINDHTFLSSKMKNRKKGHKCKKINKLLNSK